MTAADNQRSKEELNQAILSTANRLFDEHGIESVSMHQIAKTAGIGQGTLYRRYANKADLCMEMMQGQFDELRSKLEAYEAASADMPAADRLRGAVAILAAFLARKEQWLGVIQSQQPLGVGRDDFYQSAPYRFLHGFLVGLLQGAAAKGELAGPIDPAFVAHAYISVLSPQTYRHLVRHNGYTEEELTEQFGRSLVDPLFRKGGRQPEMD